EPAEQAASEVLRSFLPLDPAPIELSLLFVFRAREKHTVVMNDLLADQQISDAAPILEEVDGSFGRGNATGKVSTTRASSAVCSSAIRFSMKSRSRSDKFVRSNPGSGGCCCGAYGYEPGFHRTSSSSSASGRSAPLGRSQPHRLDAGRVSRAVIKSAERFQHFVDGDRGLQPFRRPQRGTRRDRGRVRRP